MCRERHCNHCKQFEVDLCEDGASVSFGPGGAVVGSDGVGFCCTRGVWWLCIVFQSCHVV